MDKKTLALYLDLANHHQNVGTEEIKNLCQKVLQHGFHSAFVNPCYVPLAKQMIGHKATVGTVIAFPLGQETLKSKIACSSEAVELGALELDVSWNVGMFKSGKIQECLDEMKTIVSQVKAQNPVVLVKFIIETGYLTDDEIKKASELVLQSGADFVKTCSGYGPRGATLQDVELIKSVIDDKIKIKVAGGITTYEQAIAFINAGVSRIGTSHAVEIVEGIKL